MMMITEKSHDVLFIPTQMCNQLRKYNTRNFSAKIEIRLKGKPCLQGSLRAACYYNAIKLQPYSCLTLI